MNNPAGVTFEQDLKKIIWLASYPKSGNTWTRIFLENYMSGKLTGVGINDPKEFANNSDSAYWMFNAFAEDGDASTLSDEEIDALRGRSQLLLAKRASSGIFVKTHNAFAMHEGTMLIHPQYTQRAIYIVRNPLDVVDSLADHMGVSLDRAIVQMRSKVFSLGGKNNAEKEFETKEEEDAAQQLAKQVRQYLFTWSMHVDSWAKTPNPTLLVMRYEDMLAKPYPSFKRLIEFLDMKVNKDLLRASIKNASMSNLQKQESEDKFKETSAVSKSGKFFRRGVAGAWKDILSKEQAAQIISDHGEAMKRYGYQLPDLDRIYG